MCRRPDYIGYKARMLASAPSRLKNPSPIVDGIGMVMRREARYRMTDITECMADLSATLWGQRESMTLLAFRLTAERVMVDNGHRQWLPHLDAEVRIALHDFRSGELARATAASAAATGLSLSPAAPLRAIAAKAPAPWDVLLSDHHEALTALSADVTAAARAAQALLETIVELSQQRAARLIRSDPDDQLANMTGSPVSFDDDDAAIEFAAASAAHETITGIHQRALLDFLAG